MKRLINVLIIALGLGFLSSCSSTGTMTDRSDRYGYYDNVYYHGYPSYYNASPYLYQRPIIHNDIIVVPDKKRVRSRDHVRRRETATPDSRRRVVPRESNRSIERGSNERRGSTVAPYSRESSSPAPATRRSSGNTSRRGN